METVLEIAANSFQSCLAAQDGCADRIELFENLADGGCTPSYGMLQQVKEKISIPVYIMIRPRGGDFLYTDDEFDIMERDVALCKELGFPGVVFGILDKHGAVDIERCRILLALAQPMKVTFHRAFDRCADLNKSIEQIIDQGFERVLTSGGEPNVEQGKEVIKALQQQYGRDIIIMPGCGVSENNIKAIVDYCGVMEIHATAKATVASSMQFLKPHFADNITLSSADAIKIMKHSLVDS